jgi:tetratricopeptide (TPR) repeat protein
MKVVVMGPAERKDIKHVAKTFQELVALGLRKSEEAKELLLFTKKRLSEAKRIGIDTKQAEKSFIKAQELLKSAEGIEDYDHAMDLMDESIKILKELEDQYHSAKKLITSAIKYINDLEKDGRDISVQKAQINTAKKMFKKGNYGKAIELADNSLRELNELDNTVHILEELTGSVNILITEAVKININVNKAKGVLKEILALKRNGEYDNAIKLAKKTLSSLESLTKNYRHASSLIQKSYSKIDDAKRMGADTTFAEELLKDVNQNMDRNDFKAAIDLAKKCIESAENVMNKHLDELKQRESDIIAELEKRIDELKIFGADTRNAKKIMEEVNEAKSKDDFKTFFDQTELCKNAISEARNHHKRVLDKLHLVESTINEAASSGVDVKKAREYYIKAEEALKNFDYTTAETDSNFALDEAENARKMQHQLLGLKEQAEDLLKTARATVKEYKESGMMVSNAERILEKAGTALAKSDYFIAKQHATNGLEECKKIQKIFSQVQDNVHEAESSINNAKIYIDTKEAEEIYKESVSKMKEGNYSESLELAKKTIKMIDGIKSSSKPQVTLKFPETPTLKSMAWGKLKLQVSNDGKIHVNDIKLTISDKFESAGFLSIPHLKAGENKIIDLGIRTNEVGEIPMNISLSFINSLTNEEVESQELFWVNTAPGDVSARVDVESKAQPAEVSKEPIGEVKVLSEVEFYQGYVRLKVGIKNEKDTVVTNGKLYLEYDENAIRLDYVEPELERRGNEIIFGNIHPGEKRTVAFYLDPLICTESNIDGTLTYKDIYGELKTSAMKRRKAEIVCPIFYTPEGINTAMLKRLMEQELTIHDRKIYEIPPGVDFKKASDLCKETVQAHDLKLVREFVEPDTLDPEIETWYYGVTKVKKNKVLIKTSSRKRTNTIDLFVACNNKLILTGFLAELGHNFNERLTQLGITQEPIYPVQDETKREEVVHSNSLLQHQSMDKTSLSISKRGNEYEVTFKASEGMGEASELCEFIKISPDSRTDIITQINEIVTVLNVFTCTRGKTDEKTEQLKAKMNIQNEVMGDKIAELSSLGQLIFSMFLPVPIQKHLGTIKEPLILKTNDNEIPWELLHDDTDFLCLKVPIGRRLRSREIPRTNPVKESDKVRFLFIINPTGDLEGAEEEMKYIESKLGTDIVIEKMERTRATNAAVLTALRSGNYDIIHYAGHAEFNKTSPDESALICNKERKIYAQEIKRVLNGKPFVFLNACGSGMEKMCEDGESYTGSDTEGLASSFILGGALAFIGSSWPMPDISAGILASEFYKNILIGDPVGVALHKARLHLKSTRPDDINWMAFTLYGDPTYRLTKNVR